MYNGNTTYGRKDHRVSDSELPNNPHIDSLHEDDLGDRNAYLNELLSKPLPQELQDYFIETYKLKTEEDYVEFMQSFEFIKEYARHDILLFSEQILGNVVKEFHKEFAKQVYGHRAITLAPRDTGKSHFFTVCLPIWLAFYDKSPKTLILSETDDQAKEKLDRVKETIESNVILSSELMVPLNSKESVWNKNHIKLKNGCEIKAKGFNSKLRGNHPTCLIMDDVLSDQNSLTKQQREALFQYYGRTIVPMVTKKGMIQIIGTAQHEDDLLHRLGKFSKMKFLKLKAYDEDTQESIWPERLTPEHLSTFKKTFGIVAFEKEYQNNPMADNLSLFPLHILEKCLDEDLTYVNEYYGSQKVFMGVDFSQPGKEGDYTVIPVARQDKDLTLRLLSYKRFRDDPEAKESFTDRQIESIADSCKRYNVTLGFLEDNAFQSVYAEYFKKKTQLPLRGNNVSRAGKNSMINGVPGIRILMENGKIKFPYKTPEDREKTEQIIREFNGLVLSDTGKLAAQEGHDDIPMAMYQMIEASKEVTSMGVFMPAKQMLKKGSAHSVLSGRRRKRF